MGGGGRTVEPEASIATSKLETYHERTQVCSDGRVRVITRDDEEMRNIQRKARTRSKCVPFRASLTKGSEFGVSITIVPL